MSNENGLWDPATVIGLRSSDHIVVVGNPAFLPWLPSIFAHNPGGLTSVRKASELEALLRSGRQFDRMILNRETDYSHDYALLAGAARLQLVAFPRDDGWSIEQSIEFYYPDCRRWSFDSTFGRITVAEPAGFSWRFFDA